MENRYCAKCVRVPVNEPEMIVCNICNRPFHPTCLGVLPGRADFVRLWGLRQVLCGDCDLTVRLNALDNDINNLIGQMDSIKRGASIHTTESLTYEVMERIKRAKNLIVYNFPESFHTIEQSRVDDDRQRIIREILHFCCIDFTNISVQRLGNNMGHRPRPLRVCLNRENDVHVVLRYRGLCKTGLQFRPDRTLTQRRLFRDAKTALHSLRQQGFNNVKIKYMRGVPVVVQVHQARNYGSDIQDFEESETE